MHYALPTITDYGYYRAMMYQQQVQVDTQRVSLETQIKHFRKLRSSISSAIKVEGLSVEQSRKAHEIRQALSTADELINRMFSTLEWLANDNLEYCS